ncbi:MAG TPA: M61 family peptidase [Blastocatellia bacterium]|nr:M61 family peptidase [Blastocatellia bacterium]
MTRYISVTLFIVTVLLIGSFPRTGVLAVARAAGQIPPIVLEVDAREAPRKILHARLTIPVTPGPLTLYYPKWLPGEHGPTGPILNLAGLKLSAGGQTISWQRDPVEMYAFHCQIPAGARSLEVALDFLLPVGGDGFTSAASTTAQLAVINWNQVLLYPQGRRTDDLLYAVRLQLPSGWRYATALRKARESAGVIEFEPVSLTMLVDSPLLAGAHMRTITLTTEPSPPTFIHLAADSPEALEMSPKMIADLKQLVSEAGALFGAYHHTEYHFLLALSDHVAHFGLEHHQSSDNRVPERTLLEDALRKVHIGVLSHEYVHSWNGKYRRPADLTTSDYGQPMVGDLLWVYEGLTQYLGGVLAARSGLWSPEEYEQALAVAAASLDHRPGRSWRPLADTTRAAQILYGAPAAWDAWRRGVDFYDEGWLLWLEVDAIIRSETRGARSLDDFCRRFHGGTSGGPTVKPYTFDDLVATLAEVAPYDWRGFFTTRLAATTPRAPLGGIERSGWRLVYRETPSDFQQALEQVSRILDLAYSLGLRLRDDGLILDVVPETVAARAGLGPGMRLVAVNGRRFAPHILRAALRAARTSSDPIELLVESEEFYKTYRLAYHEGERYPHLERDASRPDLLSQILKPRQTRIATSR